MSYVRLMLWQYAAWGLLGAAINRALIFLEANRRVKGPAWQFPQGPGGGYFALAVMLHCGIGAGVTAAAAASHLIASPLIALGLGATAPVVVKKVGRTAMEAVPPADGDESDDVP